MLSERLRAELLEFRRVREWEQFHTPRNLAIALSIEAAELLEPFRWVSDQDAGEIEETHRAALADEIADIAILLTYLAHGLDIDIEVAVASKIRSNASKYPIEKSRGSRKKYSEL